MSRRGVRDAVATYFGSNAVAGLFTVYSGEPRIVPSNAYFANQNPNPKSGAVGWPYIESQHDRRIVFTGGPASIGKEVIYEVAFSIRFLSYQAKGEDALDDHDSIVDAFTARLRADRTLGGALFQGGEGDNIFGDDIHVVSGPGPKQRKQGGPLVIWTMVRFIGIEMLIP